MESRSYPTDLSNDEWRCIGPHLAGPTAQGRPRVHGLRKILDAVFYVLKSGCPWRLLAKDLERRGRSSTTGSADGVLAYRRHLGAPEHRVARALLRVRLGRDPNPTAGIVDSQSLRTTAVGGTERGFDPAKKVEGILSATYWWTPKDWCSKPR
jgi:putative transposase